LSTTQADLASHAPWRRSLERSRERRAAAARLRRRRIRGKSVAILMGVVMTTGGGAALAASGRTTLLHRGSRGSTITVVQRVLGISADGVYGPRTRRAVIAFQRAHGLIVDGVVGPQTLGALGLAGAQGLSGVGASQTSASSFELAKIAQCESGGNPSAISPGGTYRGKYQFSRATWRALGGHGDPAAAPAAEQDQKAAELLQRQGRGAWPNCA
jgi:lysozyme family protein